MTVQDAQREVRTVYMGGAAGHLVSGLLWLLSAAAATWGSPGQAMAVLVVGGTFIFPTLMLTLKAMGRPATLSPGNPLGGLATQIAFTIPLSYPIIWMAVRNHGEWFYPAFMVVVGAHYLPFVFLYGLRYFAVLAGLMIVAAVAIVVKLPGNFAVGGWLNAGILLAFAAVGFVLSSREERRVAVPARTA